MAWYVAEIASVDGSPSLSVLSLANAELIEVEGG
jgi:hypothetical protein